MTNDAVQKQYYLDIEGEQVAVSKEVYRGAVAEKLPPRHTGGADQHERSLHEVEAR